MGVVFGSALDLGTAVESFTRSVLLSAFSGSSLHHHRRAGSGNGSGSGSGSGSWNKAGSARRKKEKEQANM